MTYRFSNSLNVPGTSNRDASCLRGGADSASIVSCGTSSDVVVQVSGVLLAMAHCDLETGVSWAEAPDASASAATTHETVLSRSSNAPPFDSALWTLRRGDWSSRAARQAARQAVIDMRTNDEIGDDAFHQVEEELDWLEMAG